MSEVQGLWSGEAVRTTFSREDPTYPCVISQLVFYTPSSEAITPKEAARRAKSSSTSIFGNLHLLRRILDRYEDLICARWLKKKGPQREKILLEAWPGMPLQHRPDLQANRLARGKPTKKDRNSFMFPYINLEELKHGSNLLHLLNSRGRNRPAMFADQDLDSMCIGLRLRGDAILPISIGSKAFPKSQDLPDDASGHDDSEPYRDPGPEAPYFATKKSNCMSLSGDTVDVSGKIRRYRASLTKTKNGDLPNVAEGLLILQVQVHILELLVKLCKIILRDKNLDGGLESAPVLPEPPAVHSDDGDWYSVVEDTRTTPYRLAGVSNLGRMLSLAKAGLAEWKDWALSLREDPQFFADVVGDWSKHVPAWIKDEAGQFETSYRMANRRRDSGID